MFKTRLLDAAAMNRALTRIAHEIVEKNKGTTDLVLVGILTRGVPLAKRIAAKIAEFEETDIPVGSCDITLYRDDLSKVAEQPVVGACNVPVDLNGKRVVMVDDVIYTGRTARAAMDAIMDQGRPQLIQLAALVDRGHRELPIRPDYVGKNVPTSSREIIHVRLTETDHVEEVVLVEST